MELEDSLEQDFNMKLEDGSPYEVAKMLVLLHNELLQRNEVTLNKLRQTAPVPVAASRSERVSAYCGHMRYMTITICASAFATNLLVGSVSECCLRIRFQLQGM